MEDLGGLVQAAGDAAGNAGGPKGGVKFLLASTAGCWARAKHSSTFRFDLSRYVTGTT
jgi:hypothetical protein